jgi:hypothetical protein
VKSRFFNDETLVRPMVPDPLKSENQPTAAGQSMS